MSPKPNAESQAETRARALASVPAETFETELAKPNPSRNGIVAAAVVDHVEDPSLAESRRLLRAVTFPKAASWPEQVDVDLLDAGAVATVEDAIDTWSKWAHAWEGRLAGRARLRRVR